MLSFSNYLREEISEGLLLSDLNRFRGGLGGRAGTGLAAGCSRDRFFPIQVSARASFFVLESGTFALVSASFLLLASNFNLSPVCCCLLLCCLRVISFCLLLFFEPPEIKYIQEKD